MGEKEQKILAQAYAKVICKVNLDSYCNILSFV